METDLKHLKDVLDGVILAEKRCNEILRLLLLKENERFQSPVLAKVVSVLNKLSNTPPSEVVKELEDGYGQQNLG